MENIETQVQTGAGAVQTEQNAGAVQTEQNNDALFQKLDEILTKRSDGIVKNILKENGVEDGELKNILAEYKQSKESKSKATETEIANLRKTNEELNAKLRNSEKSAIITKQADELGITKDNLKYVEKLADFSNIEKDGQFDEDAIKSALQKVLDEVPAFKVTKTETENGFVKVGSQKSEQTKEDLEANRLRKLMGLPELKK